jgi:hypothetical protein
MQMSISPEKSTRISHLPFTPSQAPISSEKSVCTFYIAARGRWWLLTSESESQVWCATVCNGL